jgi:hypothetical protein
MEAMSTDLHDHLDLILWIFGFGEFRTDQRRRSMQKQAGFTCQEMQVNPEVFKKMYTSL